MSDEAANLLNCTPPSTAPFTLTHTLGHAATKRHNIIPITATDILSSLGNVLLLINTRTSDTRYIPLPRHSSVGAIAVHPSNRYIAVGEVCKDPLVYVYKYPSMRVVRVLKGGCIRGYSCLSFNGEGSKLATVSTNPDYLLTIWNWDLEAIVLRVTAFSQDVVNVKFHPENDGILTTCGSGHIKFWNLAATFTGLKLQGSIGKFGGSTITDINDFVQLSDGKVLSSTEFGYLIVWEDGLIKCKIGVKGGKGVHLGKVEVVTLGEGEVITAGEDGYVRIWDLETIDNAGKDENLIFEMEPIDEILISKDVHLLTLVKTSIVEYIIQDRNGYLIKLDLTKRTSEKLQSFHSGEISGLATSPSRSTLVSLGVDGWLRWYDLLTMALVGRTHYPQPGSYLSYAPLSVERTGKSVIIGFQDGVVRIVTLVDDLSYIQHVIRPFRSAVKSVACSDTRMLVSSEDRIVFIYELRRLSRTGPFSKRIEVRPVGFFSMDDSINSTSFLPLNGSLLISSLSGAVYLLQIPAEIDFDTSTTYLIPAKFIEIRRWSIAVPAQSSIPLSRLSFSALSSINMSELLISSTSLITNIVPLSSDMLVLAIVNSNGETEIRLSNLSGDSSIIVGIVQGEVSCMLITNKTWILAGLTDGRVIFLPIVTTNLELLHESTHSFKKRIKGDDVSIGTIEGSEGFEEESVKVSTKEDLIVEKYSTSFLHEKRVNNISCSFDDTFVISSGQDGAIFLYRNSTIAAKVSTTHEDLEEEEEEYLDWTEVDLKYSIEEEKVEKGRDIELLNSKERKEKTLHLIGKLRSSFLQTISEGGEWDHVDPYLKEDWKKVSDEMVKRVVEELKWDAEKESIGCSKLEEKFLKPLLSERIEINALKSGMKVSTFRVLRINERKDIEMIDTKVKLNGFDEGQKLHLNTPTTPKEKESKKLFLRQKIREDRLHLLQVLQDSKPDDDYQDPLDLTNIRNAMNNMGDYKLKTASDYIVPLSEIMDAEKKRIQILLLSESVVMLSSEFNESVFELRSLKCSLVNEVKERNKRIRMIDIKLNQELDSLFEPALEEGLYPESRSIITPDDIALLKEEERLNAAAIGRKGREDGMTFIALSVSSPPPTTVTNAPIVAILQGTNDSLDTTDVKIETIKLKYERFELVKANNRDVLLFDQNVQRISNHKLLLAGDLKFADIKLQLLYIEWILLKEFEQTDHNLTEKLQVKEIEMTEIRGRIGECRDKLALRKVDVELVLKKTMKISEEKKRAIGENKHEELLTKVFKRKIKLSKLVLEGAGEEEDQESMSSYNSEENDQDFEEVIPHDCDSALWNKILQLRISKMEQDEVLADLVKAMEVLKKEHDILTKKERVIESAVTVTLNEIQEYQTQKQRKLNELEVLVPLRFHQIQNLEDNIVPSDLSASLVFSNEGIEQLKRRIKELHHERSEIKKQHRGLQKQQVVYSKSMKSKIARAADLTEKVKEQEMLRFGQRVDLDKLERLALIKPTDDTKERLNQENHTRLREIQQGEVELKRQNDKYIVQYRTNTELNEKIISLKRQIIELDRILSQPLPKLHAVAPSKEKDLAEKLSLQGTIDLKAAELEEVKREINYLRRKPNTKGYARF